jgi:hypothetical protein
LCAGPPVTRDPAGNKRHGDVVVVQAVGGGAVREAVGRREEAPPDGEEGGGAVVQAVGGGTVREAVGRREEAPPDGEEGGGAAGGGRRKRAAGRPPFSASFRGLVTGEEWQMATRTTRELASSTRTRAAAAGAAAARGTRGAETRARFLCRWRSLRPFLSLSREALFTVANERIEATWSRWFCLAPQRHLYVQFVTKGIVVMSRNNKDTN